MIDFRDSVHSMFIDEPDLPRAPTWMRLVLYCVLIASMFAPLFGPLVTAYFVFQTAKARFSKRSPLVGAFMVLLLLVIVGGGAFDVLNFDLKNGQSILVHVGFSVFCLVSLWLAINLLPRRPR